MWIYIKKLLNDFVYSLYLDEFNEIIIPSYKNILRWMLLYGSWICNGLKYLIL